MKLQIPSPCSENWNKMLPADKGRFCSSCERNIPDFTNKSDQEVLDHIKNSSGKVCGKFDPSQLNRKLIYSYKFPFRYSRITAGAIGFFSLIGSTFAQQNKKIKDEAGKEFTLTDKNKADSISAEPNYLLVNGIIKDSVNNELLPFVTVQLEGTRLTSFSDIDGNFTFKIPLDSVAENFKLRAVYVGYRSKEIEFNKKTVVRQKIIPTEVKMEMYLETHLVGEILIQEKQKNIFKRISRRIFKKKNN